MQSSVVRESVTAATVARKLHTQVCPCCGGKQHNIRYGMRDHAKFGKGKKITLRSHRVGK